MNQQALLIRLSLAYAFDAGIRLKQSVKFIEQDVHKDKLNLIEEDLKDVQILNEVELLPTEHPYKYTIKGRKNPHIVSNIRFGLFIPENKLNILITKCDKGIMNLLTYELA
jgi:hypothetical protein